VFTAAARAGAVALACALPAETGVPLSRWSCPELARELAARCQVTASASTIGRWLAADALKPWQHRSWISVRDPGFAARAATVLDLYARVWDVHRGQVAGRCEPATGITPFSRLAEQVMTAEPYASADRVFWIAGNGSSHRGIASIERMAKAWPKAHLIHLPRHASWLDQAEIYFSVVQRKALIPNDFTSLDQIRDRLAAFETRYNAIARPFSWKFTRDDLNDLLRRIDAHAKAQPQAQAA
jgi:hypothetical protein